MIDDIDGVWILDQPSDYKHEPKPLPNWMIRPFTARKSNNGWIVTNGEFDRLFLALDESVAEEICSRLNQETRAPRAKEFQPIDPEMLEWR